MPARDHSKHDDSGRTTRIFGDLRIRPKLIVLHNLFFLVLTCAAYFSLIPLVEEHITTARSRETALVREMLAGRGTILTLPNMEIYEHREGSAADLDLPAAIKDRLDASPGQVWQEPGASVRLYRKDAASDVYASVTISDEFYENSIANAKFVLLAVLGVLYLFAVLLLELVIMPRYVYRPIRATLRADRAAMQNDRQGEIIADQAIPGDEIGDIMRSRNATVASLREQEASLARTLARLEELTADLRKKNRLLEDAKEKMAAQDRLASIGLLSASVAHELNTPLSVLTGSIEKLLETVDDPDARPRLERMQRVARRLQQISAGLVDFSRPPEEEMSPVALDPLIDEAWELVSIDERASRVTFKTEAGSERVNGNRDRLIQLFVNLLRNALYAIDGAGHIVVRVSEESAATKSEVVIAVEDDGVGIPEDVLPNIFDAFVTRRLDSRGTGLGLTIAEGIVQQHGGLLRASNRPEGGARFEVRLPAVGPASATLSDSTVSSSRKAV